MFDATKLANPNVSNKAFEMAYGIALWKADDQKRGINPGSSLNTVDISLSSETDNKDDSGEDTDSSEDGIQAIRDDLSRQEQVSPPLSFPRAKSIPDRPHEVTTETATRRAAKASPG